MNPHQDYNLCSTFYDTAPLNITLSPLTSKVLIMVAHSMVQHEHCAKSKPAHSVEGTLHEEKGRFTCRKGSLMPDTSCSGEYPDMIRFFRILTNCGTSYKKTNNRTEKERYHNILCRSPNFYTFLIQHLYNIVSH